MKNLTISGSFGSLLLALSVIIFGLTGCTSTIPNKEPTSKMFPEVKGDSLTEQTVTLPTDYLGAPLVVLIGYVQRSQFDIDRWILGLMQLKTEATIIEVPTIPGMMPSLASSYISDGMRSGIPSEDWPSVVTLFSEDAKRITELLGTEKPNNARVVLLDSNGKIVWFHDRGYSAAKVSELDEAISELN